MAGKHTGKDFTSNFPAHNFNVKSDKAYSEGRGDGTNGAGNNNPHAVNSEAWMAYQSGINSFEDQAFQVETCWGTNG